MTLFRRRRASKATESSTPVDQEVARLTAKADEIVEELDDVMQQLTTLLRRKHES